MQWSKSGKAGQNIDSVAIGWALKYLINNKTKVSMAAHNIWLPKAIVSRHLLKFKEQESPTDFEYTARNNVKKIFSAS
jgi:hypothetical protein